MTTKGERINAAYEGWFKQLQALTSDALDPDDWIGRWHNGYTPADALEEGPDEDAHNEMPAEVNSAAQVGAVHQTVANSGPDVLASGRLT